MRAARKILDILFVDDYSTISSSQVNSSFIDEAPNHNRSDLMALFISSRSRPNSSINLLVYLDKRINSKPKMWV